MKVTFNKNIFVDKKAPPNVPLVSVKSKNISHDSVELSQNKKEARNLNKIFEMIKHKCSFKKEPKYTKEYLDKLDFPGVFSEEDVDFISKNDLDEESIRAFFYLKREDVIEPKTKDIKTALEKINRFSFLFNQYSQKDENGRYKSGFSYPIEEKVIACLVKRDYTDEQVATFAELDNRYVRHNEIYQIIDNYQDFKHIEHISDLSKEQKKDLLKKLTQNNDGSFYYYATDFFPLLPSDEKSYCKIVSTLAKEIGIETRKITENQIKIFDVGMKNLIKNLKETNIENLTPQLEFSTEEFINQVFSFTNNLPEKEKKSVFEYFGFELKENKIKGYPVVITENKESLAKKSDMAKNAIEKLVPIVKGYTFKNKILVKEDRSIENSLNQIYECLPEIRTLLENTDLIRQTFREISNIANSEDFEKLTEQDQKILILATLLKDITQVNDKDDKIHPLESAWDSFYILKKFGFNEDDEIKINELIKNHHWFESLKNEQKKNFDEKLKDIAFNLRFSNTFDLSKILVKSEIETTSKNRIELGKNKILYEKLCNQLKEKVNELKSRQIYLPQTKIPNASKIKDGIQISKLGIRNTVLYVDELENDLSKYGFEKGTTLKNFSALIHTFHNNTALQTVNSFSSIDSDAVLSGTFITPKRCDAYCDEGVIIDVPSSDIHMAYDCDFGSDVKKDIGILKKNFLFEDTSEFDEQKDFLSSIIKEKMELTDEDYIELITKLQKYKSVTDIKGIDNEIVQKYMDVIFENMFRQYRDYNEVLVSRPKIRGIYACHMNPEDISPSLREYAQKNDLPILIFEGPLR